MTPDEALGSERSDALRRVTDWVVAQRALTDSAETTVVTLIPLVGDRGRAWQLRERLRGGDWAFVETADGTIVAIDEPSERARTDLAGAVVYPEMHSRLVAWWLVHVWRVLDLLEVTVRDLQAWRISTAAVSARALLEETGCLLYELRRIDAAWSGVKGTATGMQPSDRASAVRAELGPVLTRAAFGSRMEIGAEALVATSVLTYIQKLAKAVGRPEVNSWYDWLSDAAHPAAGARFALASQPVVHDSGALMLQFLARRPIPVGSDPANLEGTDFTIAHRSADAAQLCGTLVRELLEHALWLVDDFGLTTSAAALTRRTYWRNFQPTKGFQLCPCGRGKTKHCEHHWGGAVRTLNLASAS